MEDERIVDLFWERNEQALRETKEKYGRYCYAIAYRILNRPEDAEECENDTLLAAWSSIPPQRPAPLSAFLGMLARRLALDRFRRDHAKRRSGNHVLLSLEELETCIPDGSEIDDRLSAQELAAILSEFIRALPQREGDIFICRYFHMHAVKEIAARYGYGQSRVKMILKRTRDRLRKRLAEKEVFL